MRIFLRVINNGDNINNNAFYPINLMTDERPKYYAGTINFQYSFHDFL
jgi:hypothetical protein